MYQADGFQVCKTRVSHANSNPRSHAHTFESNYLCLLLNYVLMCKVTELTNWLLRIAIYVSERHIIRVREVKKKGGEVK